MDGNPERQTQRDELHRVREKIPHRPTDSKTVRGTTAASGVHTVGAKANKAGRVTSSRWISGWRKRRTRQYGYWKNSRSRVLKGNTVLSRNT